MTKLDYRSLRLSQPHTDHSLFLSDMRRTKLSYQQGSREKDRPEHPHSSLSPLQLVKEEQKMCEAPPKDTLPMIYICYSMHLQELQMPFFIPASHAWCSLPKNHFHEPSPSESFSYMAADDFPNKNERSD